jgi:formylglycine-generating enzyme required for sulfatase activity
MSKPSPKLFHPKKARLAAILALCFAMGGCQQIMDRVVGLVPAKTPAPDMAQIDSAPSLQPPKEPQPVQQAFNTSTDPSSLPLAAPSPRSSPVSPSAPPLVAENKALLKEFKDCPSCPTMVNLPAGFLRMGSPDNETGRDPDESPLTPVNVAAFSMSQTEVTRANWVEFERESGYRAVAGCLTWAGDGYELKAHLGWQSPGFVQQDDHPVVCVSWQDAQAYARWLSQKTGRVYRLPQEHEWEYAARAGTSTAYPWSSSDVCGQANGADAALNRQRPQWPAEKCHDGYAFTAPVGRYPSNAWGLYDMHGNVMEWVQDCWTPQLSARDSGQRPLNCRSRVMRGGGWDLKAAFLRSAYRGKASEANRGSGTGFRLVSARP